MTFQLSTLKIERLIFFLWVVLAVGTALSHAHSAAPDLILFNGKIYTSDTANPYVEAIAISGERISVVGSSAEVRELIGDDTRVIDLEGRTVVAGFNDAHAHFGPNFQGIDLNFKSMEPTWAEVDEGLKSAITNAPKGRWIFGIVGEAVINDAKANRANLDSLAPDNPVLISTYFGHGAIFNSKAMAALDISEREADPKGGRFERDAHSGTVNGRMYEYAVWRYDRFLAEKGTDEQLISDLKRRAAVAASFGITSMQIMPGISNERFVKLLNRANLPIRIRAIAFSNTNKRGRDLSEIRALSRLKSSSNVTVSGIKWILDGTPLERGAAMRSDYIDRVGYRGRLNFDAVEIASMLRESLNLKQQILFHCSGDRSVEALLNAMEKVGAGKIDWPSKRVRIEHGEGVANELIARAKKLGVIVVQNPSHFTVVDVIHTRWGRNTPFSAQHSLIEAGIPYALGSDGPINPFLNIMFATLHPARPSEAITREQAVWAYTSGSAYAEFAEKQKGTLATGRLADLAVLSQDIFTVPVDALPVTTSVMTIVGGKIVHDTKVLE